MTPTRVMVLVLLLLVLTLPLSGKTYKSAYPNSCSEIWPAVKTTLADGNYEVKLSDDAKMTADYEVKHSVHADISGTVLQRTNRVTLVPKGTGCEMQVVSNWSGWGHNDRGDFKSRVDEELAKLKAAPAATPAKPAEPPK